MNLRNEVSTRFSEEIKTVFETAARVADKHRKRVALVGGVVRDLLLKRPIGDADIMFEHPAKNLVEEMAKNLKAELISYERFFTFTLVLPSKKRIDVVTAREEMYSAPAKLPDVVPSTFENDLKRRDFTINAILCKLNKATLGELDDPFEGKVDLDRKAIKAIHPKSFLDDPTRIYRAARFAGRLGFNVEKKTEEWICESIAKGIPERLSPVRRRHEFEMILKEDDPIGALEIVRRWNALKIIHPDWETVVLGNVEFSAPVDLNRRLAEWFRMFGKERAQKMMTDLSFEKSVKAHVLSKLVQSPSKL